MIANVELKCKICALFTSIFIDEECPMAYAEATNTSITAGRPLGINLIAAALS